MGLQTKYLLQRAAAPLNIFNVQDYGWVPDGTDHSSKALALISAVSNAGGGTIYFPPSTGVYRADSQLLIPNDGNTTPDAAMQANIRFTGAGGGQIWGDLARGQVGAATLDLRYTAVDGNAKIESRGAGSLTIDNLTLKDGGSANATPFIHTTNTTLTIRDNTFKGSGHAGQDAIVLGGASNQTPGIGVTAPFQGYGTVISGNHFRAINRGVFGRTFSNSVVVAYNAWLDPAGDRAMEFTAATGNPPDLISGLYVVGNVIEVTGAVIHGIVLQGVRYSYFANSFYDANGSYVSDYHLIAPSLGKGCTLNTFVEMLPGGATTLTQTGDAVQLTLNNRISAVGNNNFANDGQASSIFSKGIEVDGSWNLSNAAAGQLNLRAEFSPNELFAIGLDDVARYLDAWSTAGGGFNRPLVLQPRGGPTSISHVLALTPSGKVLSNGLNFTIGLWAADATAKSSFIRITGPTGAFSIGGFSNESSGVTNRPGSLLTIYNSTSQQMTIVNEDATTVATARIKTLTGADVVLRAGTSCASFMYDDTDSRWILVSTN